MLLIHHLNLNITTLGINTRDPIYLEFKFISDIPRIYLRSERGGDYSYCLEVRDIKKVDYLVCCIEVHNFGSLVFPFVKETVSSVRKYMF